MDVLAWITGLVLIVGFGMAGLSKVTAQPAMVEVATRLGFTSSQFKMIGGAELAGAAGVLIGLLSGSLEWLGVLAALGLVATAIGAFAMHRRAGDETKDSVPSLVLAAIAVVHAIAAGVG